MENSFLFDEYWNCFLKILGNWALKFYLPTINSRYLKLALFKIAAIFKDFSIVLAFHSGLFCHHKCSILATWRDTTNHKFCFAPVLKLGLFTHFNQLEPNLILGNRKGCAYKMIFA